MIVINTTYCWFKSLHFKAVCYTAVNNWPRNWYQRDTVRKNCISPCKEMTTHSSILAWRIPWTEEPGGLQSTGSQKVGHDWATSLSLSYSTSLDSARLFSTGVLPAYISSRVSIVLPPTSTWYCEIVKFYHSDEHIMLCHYIFSMRWKLVKCY